MEGGYLVNNLKQRLQQGTPPSSYSDIKVDDTKLEKISAVDDKGLITSSAGTLTNIPIALVDFPDQHGLKAAGDTQWTETTASGVPVTASPTIKAGFLENSNVDLTAQLVNMIIAQRDFTANAKTITTNDAITQVAVNISR